MATVTELFVKKCYPHLHASFEFYVRLSTLHFRTIFGETFRGGVLRQGRTPTRYPRIGRVRYPQPDRRVFAEPRH